MNRLNKLLTQPLKAVPISWVIALFVIALLGFVDATYLTFEHYLGVVPPCTLTTGCEQVLTSVYATFYGVPVALFGALYYFLVLVGTFAYLEGRHEKMLRCAMIFSVFGILASIWFVFLQAFILHSYCIYCLGSAATSFLLFIISCFVFIKYSTDEIQNGHE